jgi:hypothetical protein
MRNKAGLALIVLQVAITLAVVCNSLFIILERFERMQRPSGIDESNTFIIAKCYRLSRSIGAGLRRHRRMLPTVRMPVRLR